MTINDESSTLAENYRPANSSGSSGVEENITFNRLKCAVHRSFGMRSCKARVETFFGDASLPDGLYVRLLYVARGRAAPDIRTKLIQALMFPLLSVGN